MITLAIVRGTIERSASRMGCSIATDALNVITDDLWRALHDNRPHGAPMPMAFEERLADLIDECLPLEGRDAIMSGLELHLMAQKEAEDVLENDGG